MIRSSFRIVKAVVMNVENKGKLLDLLTNIVVYLQI